MYENSCKVTKSEYYNQAKKLSKGIVFGVGQLHRRKNKGMFNNLEYNLGGGGGGEDD